MPLTAAKENAEQWVPGNAESWVNSEGAAGPTDKAEAKTKDPQWLTMGFRGARELAKKKKRPTHQLTIDGTAAAADAA